MSEFQHTRVIIRVDSHVSGAVFLSDDVESLNTSKSIKGSGKCQLTIVPRKNYLNLIFPNDYVNLYMDPGDGKRGFIRTFFGLVDRVELQTRVTDNNTGATTTRFIIYCSDFYKAIDRTDIYFNPQLKTIVDTKFGFRIEGLAGANSLAIKGLTVNGTPASLLINTLLVVLGFGNQWNLPPSYPKKFLKASRDRKLQRAYSQIPNESLETLKLYGIDTSMGSLGSSDSVLDIIAKLQRSLGLNGLFNEDTTNAGVLALTGAILSNAVITNLIQEGEYAIRAFQTVYESSKSAATGILDILDFSFIEDLAIDGYILEESIWDVSGSLGQFLYGHANEHINELFFDLRPVCVNQENDVDSTNISYSYDEDELGINVHGDDAAGYKANVPAVKYVPAVVMREYPYSVVEGIDFSGFGLTLMGEVSSVGVIPFGPIFAQQPNSPGRIVYDYNQRKYAPIPPNFCTFRDRGKAIKKLDSVSIKITDIINSTLGRDDEEVINLLAFNATGPGEMAVLWKYELQDFSPIQTPVSIHRNGLRVREATTPFANFPASPQCRDSSVTIDNLSTRKHLLRWQLLLDHWNQHNIEYLNGNMDLRGMPELRVGYRLDIPEQNMSYYVDQVSHNWSFPGALTTTVHVSRGQRNDPYPAYIPPIFVNQSGRTSAQPAPVADNQVTTWPTKQSESALSSATQSLRDAIQAKRDALGFSDMPIDFLLGWVQVESNGALGLGVSSDDTGAKFHPPKSAADQRLSTDFQNGINAYKSTTKGGLGNLDEHGYFQLNWEESKLLGIISGNPITDFSNHDKLATDQDYSIEWGLKLVNYYRTRYADNIFGGPGNNLADFWAYVKFIHSIGQGGSKTTLNAVITALGRDPINWPEFHATATELFNSGSLKVSGLNVTRWLHNASVAAGIVAYSSDQTKDLQPNQTEPDTSTLQQTASLDVYRSGDRSSSGRLGQFFEVKDPTAVERALGNRVPSATENTIDLPNNADHEGRAEYSSTVQNRPKTGDEKQKETFDELLFGK